MTQLLKCDQCGTVTAQDEGDWLITTDLQGDDDTLAYWHFCGWACAGIYATVRALVDS